MVYTWINLSTFAYRQRIYINMKRDKSINTRLSDSEIAILNKRADSTGLNVSDYIRLMTVYSTATITVQIDHETPGDGSKKVSASKDASTVKIEPVAKNTDPIKQAKKFVEKVATEKPFDNNRFSKIAMSARAKH